MLIIIKYFNIEMSKNKNQGKILYQEKIKKRAYLSASQTKNKKTQIRINKKWTKEEDLLLSNLIHMQKVRNWTEISKKMLGRTGFQCHLRWNKIKLGIKKGQWSIQEDKLLKEWIKKNGPKRWEQCGQFINGRSGKQCREHWNNCLNPDLVKGEWTAEEDFLIVQFYEKYDGSWKKIIPLFNGRTENSIKNRFFSQLRKIATKKGNILEKSCCKIKLEELKKYLSVALSEQKKKFLSKSKMTEEELENYLNEKNLLIKNKILKKDKNSENISTKIKEPINETEEEKIIKTLVDDIYEYEEKILEINSYLEKSQTNDNDTNLSLLKKKENTFKDKLNLIKIKSNDDIKKKQNIISAKQKILNDIENQINIYISKLSEFNTLSFNSLIMTKYIISNNLNEFLTKEQIDDIINNSVKEEDKKENINDNNNLENNLNKEINKIKDKMNQIKENILMMKEEKKW